MYVSAEWPHGLRCAACGGLFVEGQPISERLHAFVDELPIVVVTCVACGLAGAPLGDDPAVPVNDGGDAR